MAEFTFYEQQELMLKLSEEKRLIFQSRLSSEMKDRNTVLILSVLLGHIGVDRFYIGDIGLGLLKLFTLGLCGVLWLIDIFIIRDKVDDFNRRKAHEIFEVMSVK